MMLSFSCPKNCNFEPAPAEITARSDGPSGWSCNRQGGLGGQANQVVRPAGDITCLACLARFLVFRFRSFLYQFYFNLVSFFRIYFAQSRLFAHSFVAFIFVSFLSLNLATGCATLHRSDAKMLRVLKAEDALLLDLKEDRRSQALAKKLQGDTALSQAEERLRDSIDALIKANAELRSAIKNY